jgi:NAD(P)-dependent dehydrogenase (short-subunit alcohol dehydrogenase family)
VNILTKNMALDLAGRRIRVNSVSPAWIWSPEVAKVPGLDCTVSHLQVLH